MKSRGNKITNEMQTSYEPEFTKNGELVFIKKNSSDSLKVIDIEIADTKIKRDRGLMWRRSMADNQGMLFIFENDQPRSFWMKNCYFPLDIIYVNNKMEIVSIRENMKPYNEKQILSEFPAKYVVEVNTGFCNKQNIHTGDEISYKLTK